MMKTEEYFDIIAGRCREIFILKMQDYGPSWRTMRPISLCNQLFIKVKRIREIEETGVNMVGDSLASEFMAIVNYSVMALIQQKKHYANRIDMSAETALQLYDEHIAEARELMLRKNHDYGEAWKDMDTEAITDMIFNKIVRNKTILRNQGKTTISEGVEGNYFDIINYAIFNLIHYENK